MALVPGLGVGDLVGLAKTAWKVYNAIKDAPGVLREIRNEFGGLALCMQSLNESDIHESMRAYAKDDRKKARNLELLVENLQNSTEPMKLLVKKYKRKVRGKGNGWRNIWTNVPLALDSSDIQEVRNRLVVHTASLNIFLTRLTHFAVSEMTRTTKRRSMVAGKQAGIAALRQDTKTRSTAVDAPDDDGLDGVWTSIGRTLVTGAHSKDEIVQGVRFFEDEIRQFALSLLGSNPSPDPRRVERSKRTFRQRTRYDTEDNVHAFAANTRHAARSRVQCKREELEHTFAVKEENEGELKAFESMFNAIGCTADQNDLDDSEDSGDSDDVDFYPHGMDDYDYEVRTSNPRWDERDDMISIIEPRPTSRHRSGTTPIIVTVQPETPPRARSPPLPALAVYMDEPRRDRPKKVELVRRKSDSGVRDGMFVVRRKEKHTSRRSYLEP